MSIYNALDDALRIRAAIRSDNSQIAPTITLREVLAQCLLLLIERDNLKSRKWRIIGRVLKWVI